MASIFTGPAGPRARDFVGTLQSKVTGAQDNVFSQYLSRQKLSLRLRLTPYPEFTKDKYRQGPILLSVIRLIPSTGAVSTKSLQRLSRPTRKQSMDSHRQDGRVAVPKLFVYQFLASHLSQACNSAILRGNSQAAAIVRTELNSLLLSMSSEDTIGLIVSSIDCRKKLLELSSILEISDDHSFRAAVRTDEEGLATLLSSVLDTESMTASVLSLEGTRAQCFLDVAQDVLDRGLLMGREHTVQRIIRKLSETSDTLPSSLFITGVTGRGETPTFGGAFGDIYRASFQDKPVALKHIRHYMRGSELRRIRSKFCREALLWKELNHPNILPFLGIDRESFPSSFCMVSPWMENGTVLSFLKDHGRTRVNKLLYEIAQGLEYLHSRNIVHGDLRGGNILITSDWQACLADFGLSVFSDVTASTSSMRAGSLRWMAPELIHPDQFGGRFARTPASDVYAFACVCFELYTGKPPFAEFSEPAAFMNVLKGERPGRPDGPPVMSSMLWNNVTSCWAEDPATRPTTQIVVQNLALVLPSEVWPRIRVSSPQKTIEKAEESTSSDIIPLWGLPPADSFRSWEQPIYQPSETGSSLPPPLPGPSQSSSSQSPLEPVRLRPQNARQKSLPRVLDSMVQFQQQTEDDHAEPRRSPSTKVSITTKEKGKSRWWPWGNIRDREREEIAPQSQEWTDPGTGGVSEPMDDEGISMPWNFQHNVHVDEAFTGIPPSWTTALQEAGFTDDEIAAIQQRRMMSIPHSANGE